MFSGNSEFRPAPDERGLGALFRCLETLPGLQTPCECVLIDWERPGSFPAQVESEASSSKVRAFIW